MAKSKGEGGFHAGINLPFVGFTGFSAGKTPPPSSAGNNWLPWVIGGGIVYYLAKHGYLPELTVAAPPAATAPVASAPTQPLARQGG